MIKHRKMGHAYNKYHLKTEKIKMEKGLLIINLLLFFLLSNYIEYVFVMHELKMIPLPDKYHPGVQRSRFDLIGPLPL